MLSKESCKEVFDWLKILASSANKLNSFLIPMFEQILLIKIKNRKGPTTPPCGTPL